ncbi:hypothetical protein F4776DRAFT_662538 [Hypoxylon sp. NC0597]|nr:hypothetical protein F4776DRAFT_662538 [Hypoxylon sp. NC0597]
MARLRRRWTAEEDALLRRAVETTTAQGRPLLWRDLAKSVPGRSNKDCRRRWWNSLADGTTKGPWCEEEDERLIEADANLLHAVLTHSTNWATIAASHVPPRTRLALKNRYSTLRLRHENENKREQNIKKSVETSPSNFDVAMWNSQVQMHPTRTPDEGDISVESDEDDEDDEDDENEEYDGNEGNHQDEKVQNGSNTTSIETGPTLSGVNTSVLDIQMQDPSMTPDNWTGFSERGTLPSLNTFHHGNQIMPIENWGSEMANQAQYEGLFELTTGENYLCDIENPGLAGAELPYKSYAATPTDVSFSDPMDFHGLTRTITVDPSITRNIEGTEASPPPSSRDTPPIMSFGNSWCADGIGNGWSRWLRDVYYHEDRYKRG